MGGNQPFTRDDDYGCGCRQPNDVVRERPGYGTGETVIVTRDGTAWLSVSAFPLYRATGERRGIREGGRVYEI